jgi:tetratricopeptide (TPR) repeat protein
MRYDKRLQPGYGCGAGQPGGIEMAVYDAFISYSHAKDKPIAAALQSVVQALGKPWYKRRAVRIFRDDTSLSATPHLWPTIEAALNESRFLILLASAEAARSMWVGKEVAYWLEHKTIDTLLIAVTDGELAWPPGAADFTWSDATPLPPVLKGRFPNEPKWVDLRAYRAGASKRDRKFTELGADFAAAVRGVAKEDLLSEEVRQQRRALTLAWSAVAVLFVLGGVAAWQWKAALDAERVAVQQRQVAEQQRDRATVAERTATEQKQIAEQQRDRATAAEHTAVEQKQIAEQQRDRAERTLNAATGTANGLVSDLAVKFREVRGIPLTVVKGILGRGKGLLDDLLSFNETTPSVQLIRARTWTELGFTLAQQDDPEGARLVADAYQIAGTLAHDSPNLAGVDYARGRAAEVMAQLRERSDLKSAYDLNREAVESYAKCYAEHPTELPCLLQEFMTFGRLGNIFLSNKQFSDALTVYQKSLELAQSYARLVPPGPDVGFYLGGRYNHLGRVYVETHENSNAMQQFRLAQQAMEPWAGDARACSTMLFELAGTYNNIATMLAAAASSDRDKLREAISYTQRAVAIMESLSASDPTNRYYWSNLAADYDNLEFLSGLTGNRNAQEFYARKRQEAIARAKGGIPGNVAQSSSQ